MWGRAAVTRGGANEKRTGKVCEVTQPLCRPHLLCEYQTLLAPLLAAVGKRWHFDVSPARPRRVNVS